MTIKTQKSRSKICPKCGVDKPLGAFHRDASRVSGYAVHCKTCRSVRPNRRNENYKRYGITLEKYESLYTQQRGECAICGEYKERLAVDHCHNTGEVRGLLCSLCNTGIGALGDSLEGVLSAAWYLLQHTHEQ